MKAKLMLTLIPAALLAVSAAKAQSDIFYTVPFQQAEVKIASKIHVNYQIDPQHQTVVCTSAQANDAITSVEWSYKDATRKIELPVKLHDDARVKGGHYADPEGKMVITNEFGSSSPTGSIYVSCDYQKIS